MSDLVEFIEAEIDRWLGKAVVQDSANKKQLYMDYVDRFRQVAEALRSMEWINIETPPKDGDLVFTTMAGTEIINACFYHNGIFECTQSGNDVTAFVSHYKIFDLLPFPPEES